MWFRLRCSGPAIRSIAADGHFAEMVTGDLAGRFEAPIYGMLEVETAMDSVDWGDVPRPEVRYHGQPTDELKPTLLWDGEWEITYVTFRDMGLAFAFAILGIYLLVVAQFGSFSLPLVILAPVPLTLIGIVFGHWLFSAPFSATSMIGFIALAGIIVRNSILLVDFIRHGRKRGGIPARDPAEGRGDPLQADLPDRGRRDHRRGLHPGRPDLPGAGDLAGFRPGLVDRADPARHPGLVYLAAR